MFLHLILIVGLLPSLALLASPQQARAQTGSLLFADWTYHQRLSVHNNAASALAAGYTLQYVLDTAALVSQGQLQADCDDLRVSYGEGTGEVELDRLVDGCNTAATTVWFQTQADIPTGSDDLDYHLHFGYGLAGAAPADPASVFAFYDDFQDGDAAGWNAAKGTWGVVEESGNYFYRYTGGGATWAVAYHPQTGLSDLEYTARLRAAVDTTWIGLAFRLQDANNFLTFYQSRDTSQFKYARVVSDNHNILQSPAFTMAAGAWYNLRVQAVGSQVRARIWQAGTAEPAGWNIEYSDSTFQAQSNIGATLYYHTTNADWDDFQARHLVANEPTITASWEHVPWWDADWDYRQQLTVTNQSASNSLLSGYTVQSSFDTAALIAAGKLRSDCADLRLVYFDGAANQPLDRLVEDCNTDHTRVRYALQSPLAANGQDTSTFLYYGNALAGAPPADPASVFAFYDDFQDGDAAGWIAAKGTWGVVEESGNYLYRYTGGGPAWAISYVPQANLSDLEYTARVRAAANTNWIGLAFRIVDPNNFLTFYQSRDVNQFKYARVINDDHNPPLLPYPAYTMAADTWYNLRVQALGSTVRARLWPVGAAEPTAWNIEFSDSTFQSQSGIGATLYNHTTNADWDDFQARYLVADEPLVSAGLEETTLPSPEFASIVDNGPVNLGSTAVVSASVSTAEGTIDAVTLRLVTPVALDLPMSLVSGTDTDGDWEASYTPSQAGTFTYQVLAHATTDRATLSPTETFTVADSQAPTLSELTFSNPLLVRATQTVSVRVTDNGQVADVTLEVDGSSHAMTPSGDVYEYTWQANTLGEVPFTITATDTAGNEAELSDSFTVQARDVDVCTWKDCKVGAESWSNDDGSNTCKTELETAGFRGTFFYNGSTTQSWFSTYTADGHEIASHTVSHPCNTPCCSPTCTPESLAACPYTITDVNAYREDQLEPNIEAIEAGSGEPVLSLAWPCGCTDPGRMEAASYNYLGARGYYDWIANLTWLQDVNLATPVNLYNLNSANAYDQTFIDRAASEGSWAIITAHGSCAGIDYMGSRQDVLWAAPVGEVLKYIYVRDHAQLSNYSRVGRTISFDAVHTLSPFERPKVDGSAFAPILFDNPVTLQVKILDTDVVESVVIDGAPAVYTVRTLQGVRYVLIDAALDASRHVVVNLGAPAPTIEQVADNSPVELGQAAEVSAVVTLSEGALQSVTLQVLSPVAADYPMSLAAGTTDTYTATFPTTQLADYTYQVTANSEAGSSAQSVVYNLPVQDTTPPEWRGRAQDRDNLHPGAANGLSAEGRDLGGLEVAILATDESGVWQEFNWSILDWWDHDWPQRAPLTLQETVGLARQGEIVDVLVSSDQLTGLADCAAELRVADTNRQELPIQVYDEQNTGGTLTCRLLFPASVPANGSSTFYIYYGNPGATPPSYTSDLSSSTAGGLLTVQNSYFNLDLDVDSGVISRLRLPQGTNTNLPLSSEANAYWGWHQVCSSADGNITGKNNLCVGGTAPASGLSLQTTQDGPLMKEYTFTSVKGVTTYTMVYRFYAGVPYYQYQLARVGSSASVMNNFWYTNGYFSRLGIGTGGTPATIYNTYGNGADQLRIASFDSVAVASIDGTDNDGTDLGGSDYQHPTAAGLDLWVTTGSAQAETETALGRLATPLSISQGAVEDAPTGQYGSPLLLNGATDWTTAAFTWQNPAVPAGSTVQWRVRFCDLSGNCITTDSSSFAIVLGNLPPAAAADGYETDEDTLLEVAVPGVLGNDSDPDLDPLTAALESDVSHGTLTLNPDGSFSYLPDSGYHGTDSFTYRANDGSLDSDPATVTITIRSVNDDPVAVVDSATTDEDTPVTIAVLANDSDADGDPLSVSAISQPAHGTVVNNGADVTYTPAGNYCGPDSFAYQASDGQGGHDSATVSVTVTCVNDDPVAVDDSAATDEETPVSIDVLDNDTDVDGDPLTIDQVTQPGHGQVVFTDDELTYTPAADYCGPDSFSYTVADGQGGFDSAGVIVAVVCLNDAPLAADDAYETAEDTLLSVPAPGVLGNDSDVDGDALAVSLAADAAHGTLTLHADGSFEYLPAANYHGPDSFSYTLTDGLLTDSATVTITVLPENDPPFVDAGEDRQAVEGEALQFSGSYIDPALLAHRPLVPDLVFHWDFGDGTSTTGTLFPLHVYADEGQYTVTLTVTDDLGAAGTDTLLVTVSNADPVFELSPTGPDLQAYMHAELVLALAFNDAGWLDAHSLLVDWGDGVETLLSLPAGVLAASPAHTYHQAGVYTVVVTLSDEDGGQAVVTYTVTVEPGFALYMPVIHAP